MNAELQKWIDKNAGADLATLLLKAGNDAEKRDAAVQIVARRKAAGKIPSLLTNEQFRFPTVLSAEQCTSELLAHYHSTLIEEGDIVADLTTGLGIDSIFLSHRASSVTSVEIDAAIAQTFSDNIKALAIRNVRSINADSMEWLADAPQFDVIFIDPYRRDKQLSRVYSLEASTPDVIGNLDLLLSHCKKLIVKSSPMIDLTDTLKLFGGHASKIITVGTAKECKEIVIVAKPEQHDKAVRSAVTIFLDGQFVEITADDDADYSSIVFLNPSEGSVLYEPHPAVMKAGLYHQLALQHNLNPISPNTHLLVSDNFVPGIQAQGFELERVIPFDKRSCKAISKEFTHLNVAVRNFPLKAPELERRLGVKPGGDKKVYGVTLADGSYKLLLVRPL